MRFLAFFLVVAVLSCQVQSHPDGAPSNACNDMKPQHGPYQPQPGEPPYAISFQSGGDLNYAVTLAGSSFLGFFVQAQDANGDPVGAFEITDGGNSQLRPCGQGSANGVTHVNNNGKTTVSFNWSPDGSDLTGVRFVATVVKEYSTYWTGVESAEVV